MTGEGPYAARELSDAVGAPVIGVLADDPRGAALLYRSGARSARRVLLVRSARSVLESLLTRGTEAIPDVVTEDGRVVA